MPKHGLFHNTLTIWAILMSGIMVWRLAPGVPLTHDAEPNIARFAAYYQSFRDGQFPPRWAGELNYSYGSPVLSFSYPLPGYAATLFRFMGIPYETAFIILAGLSFFGGMFLWYRFIRLFYGYEVSLISAVLFSSVPYSMLNMFVRGDVGELMAYALIPSVLYAIERHKPDIVGYAALILSHNIVAYLITPVFFAYALVRAKSAQILFAGGILASSFYWLPALYEQRYVLGSLFIGNMYKDQFLPFQNLVFYPWGYGAIAGIPGGQAPQIGPVIAVCVLILLFFKKRNTHTPVPLIFWFGVLGIYLFIITGWLPFVWDIVPFLPMVQFPWRLLSVVSVSAVVISTVCINYFFFHQRFMLYILFVCTLAYTWYSSAVNGYVHHEDGYYETYRGTTYYHGQTTPVWTAGDASEIPANPVDIIGGDAVVSDYTRKSNLHTFTVTAKNEAIVMDNTVFFPGWRVSVDDHEVPVQFQDPSHRGIITFTVPEGVSDVRVWFSETKIRMLGDMVSLVSWMVLVGWAVIRRIGLIRRIC